MTVFWPNSGLGWFIGTVAAYPARILSRHVGTDAVRAERNWVGHLLREAWDAELERWSGS